MTRRHYFSKAAAAAAGTTVLAGSLARSTSAEEPAEPPLQEPARIKGYQEPNTTQAFPTGEPGQDYAPVITPNNVPSLTTAMSGLRNRAIIAATSMMVSSASANGTLVR